MSRRVCPKCAGYHECHCTLERVADALERIALCLENPPVTLNYSTAPMHGTPQIIGSYGGYQCGNCHLWVMAGQTHACSAGGSGSGGTISLFPNRCSYVTAANMQCTLDLGHGGVHNIGIG